MVKKRKYFIWMLLFAWGMCFLVACGDKKAKTNYTGTWKVIAGKANGITLTAEQLTSTLGTIAMNVEDEGKITKKEGIGLDENGKWSSTETGIIVSDLDGTNSVVFTYKNGTLIGDMKGIEITLKK